MHGQQSWAERQNGSDGSGDGIGNVVQFQIEKDFVAFSDEPLDKRSASRQVKLETDLYPSGCVSLGSLFT
jgi:hypothetical protein